MIEDMTIRRLKERTQDFYLRSVTKYAQHFRRSPGELDYEHVRQYQLHLIQSGWKPSYVNHTMSALRSAVESDVSALASLLRLRAQNGALQGPRSQSRSCRLLACARLARSLPPDGCRRFRVRLTLRNIR